MKVQDMTGTDKEHTVFEGEELGMILAAKLLQGERRVRLVSLGIDNKVAIAATKAYKSKPGHYLMDLFHHTLTAALQTIEANKITMRWTPGHSGIPGNEEANAEAKEAAKGSMAHPNHLPKALKSRGTMRVLPISKSAKKQTFTAANNALHQRIFQSSPRALPTGQIDPMLPLPKFLKLINELPKRCRALLSSRLGSRPSEAF